MSRKATPDILGEIMGDLKKEDNKAIKQEGCSSTNIESNKAIKQESNKKEKVTFNLSVDIQDKLEDAWASIRKEKRGTRITKTLIVETALKNALEEYREKASTSTLFKSL